LLEGNPNENLNIMLLPTVVCEKAPLNSYQQVFTYRSHNQFQRIFINSNFILGRQVSHDIEELGYMCCSEHKLFGCAKHWASHKKNKYELCEPKGL
jgi:hypothetical protein